MGEDLGIMKFRGGYICGECFKLWRPLVVIPSELLSECINFSEISKTKDVSWFLLLSKAIFITVTLVISHNTIFSATVFRWGTKINSSDKSYTIVQQKFCHWQDINDYLKIFKPYFNIYNSCKIYIFSYISTEKISSRIDFIRCGILRVEKTQYLATLFTWKSYILSS